MGAGLSLLLAAAVLPGVPGVSAQTPPEDPPLPVVTLTLESSSGLDTHSTAPHDADFTTRIVEQSGTLTFRVHVDPPLSSQMWVNVAAVQGGHFLATADVAKRVPVTGSGDTFMLNVEDDTVDEGHDFLVVEIQPGDGYVVGGPRSYRGLYIYDNDSPDYLAAPTPGRLSMRLSRSSGEEGEGFVKVKLLTNLPAHVDYTLCAQRPDGVALAVPGADYDLISWRTGRAETWTPLFGVPDDLCLVGLNTARDTEWWLKVWDDSAVEGDEEIHFELTLPLGIDEFGVLNLLVWPSGTVRGASVNNPYTIIDNDAVVSPQAAVPVPVVSLRADAVSVREGGVVSFTVSAVPAPVSDLVVNVFAEEESGAGLGFRGVGHRAEVTVPAGAGSVSWAFASMSDDADHPDGSVDARVDPPAVHGSYVVGDPSAASVVVTDDDAPAPSADSVSPVLDAQLLADVRSYAGETRHGTLHVNRWKRVLEAFGAEDYAGLEPTTLDEARVHVDIGRPRWVAVLAHMAAADAADPQPPPARGSVHADAQVLATARAKAAQTRHGTAHVNRWKRALEAFGDGDYPDIEPLTAAGAQVYANVWPAWTQVAAQIRLIEAAATTDPPPATVSPVVVQPPVVVPPPVIPPTPEVSITAGADVAEGGSAAFTVTASPAPASDLDVTVTVAQSGDYGAATGTRTVTVPTSGSVSFAVATSDDSADEPDGSVTATVGAAGGYTVSATQEAGTVAVADNDVPTPQVSITAGSDVTEGGSATFTLTASPAPATDLDVTVTVAQSGDFGTATGTRTVTVPTSGSVSFAVATSDDSADEPDGSVTATVSNGSGYTVSAAQGAGTVGVADNDDPPPASTVTVSVGDASGSEAGGVVEFTVSLSEASGEQVRVWFSTSNWRGLSGRAKMWLDYWTAQQTVAFAPGQTERTVSVWLVDDSRPEPDEHFTVTLTNPRGAAIGQGAATGTITDDD